MSWHFKFSRLGFTRHHKLYCYSTRKAPNQLKYRHGIQSASKETFFQWCQRTMKLTVLTREHLLNLGQMPTTINWNTGSLITTVFHNQLNINQIFYQHVFLDKNQILEKWNLARKPNSGKILYDKSPEVNKSEGCKGRLCKTRSLISVPLRVIENVKHIWMRHPCLLQQLSECVHWLPKRFNDERKKKIWKLEWVLQAVFSGFRFPKPTIFDKVEKGDYVLKDEHINMRK